MKILIDVRLLSKGKTSGIEEYTRSLLDNLFESDKKNEYSLFYNGFKKAPLPARWRNNKKIRIVDKRVPNKLLDFSFRTFNFLKIKELEEADLIWSPHFNILPKLKTRRVVTFHDLSLVHFPEFYPRRKRFWHWLQNYKEQARLADKIIAVSEFTKNDIIKTLGIEEKKIDFVYSGIKPAYGKVDKFDDRLVSFCRSRDLISPFLLFVGVLEPRKNIQGIIKAFNVLKKKKNFRDFCLVIVGERGWLYNDIIKEADRSPYRKQIKFWGHASEEELLFLYNLASVFVYPSFFEGFGFPPLEAQACGAPVIASNRASLPEILGDSALLVNPSRMEELVYAVELLTNDGNLRDEMVKRGFKNAARFNWSKTANSVINILFETKEQNNQITQ